MDVGAALLSVPLGARNFQTLPLVSILPSECAKIQAGKQSKPIMQRLCRIS